MRLQGKECEALAWKEDHVMHAPTGKECEAPAWKEDHVMHAPAGKRM